MPGLQIERAIVSWRGALFMGRLHKRASDREILQLSSAMASRAFGAFIQKRRVGDDFFIG